MDAFIEQYSGTLWWTAGVFVAILAVTWLVARLFRRILQGTIGVFTARTDTTLDDRMVVSAAGPGRMLVWAAGLSIALKTLPPNLFRYEELIQHIAGALVILAVTAMVAGLVRAFLDWYVHELAAKSEGSWDLELLPIVRRVSGLIIYFIGVTIILDHFGQDITALVTTAGVASLAVALAAQDTLSNMIGGFVILMDRPFRVGDVIELPDGKMGEVIDIGIRSTKIRQFDGNAIVMPNKDLSNSRITNFALPNPRAAIRQTISVDHGTDIEKAKQVLLDVISAHPDVLKDPAPGVNFTAFAESSLNLFMSCWVESFRDRVRVTDELNRAILSAFRENGIAIAYPQRNVHLYVKNQGAAPEVASLLVAAPTRQEESK